MELDRRLDAYAELVSRYARNSVSLEHTYMVNRGSVDGYYEVAKYELRGRKISNRMDEFGNNHAGQCLQGTGKNQNIPHTHH